MRHEIGLRNRESKIASVPAFCYHSVITGSDNLKPARSKIFNPLYFYAPPLLLPLAWSAFARLVWSGLIFLLVALSPAVRGAVRIWSGGGANNNWTTAGNWGGAAPVAGDDLVFPAGAARLSNTNDFASGTGFRSLSFSGSNYVLRGTTPAHAIGLTNGIDCTNPTGTNTINLGLTLGAPQAFNVAGATAWLQSGSYIALGTNTLTVSGSGNAENSGTISGNGGVTKNNTGTLRYDGLAINTYDGTTTINAGTLELAKPPSVSSRSAISGPLVIGDGTGSDVVRLVNSDQIDVSSIITINGSGLLDLDGNSDTIASLTMSGGAVTTDAGTLTLGGNLTTLGVSTTASISGKLSLGGVTRIFNVASGAASPDLIISAVISDGAVAGAGFTKSNSGQMTLSGANTFTGPTTLSGFVILTHESALGASGQSTNGTVANPNTFLLVQGVNVTNEFLTLAGSADFRSSGIATWGGPITLNGNVDINVFGGTFTNSGVISGAGGFTKGQSGTLILSGPSGNTYLGNTVVNTGILQLSKNFGQVAIRNGALAIGDDVGGDGADIVRYTVNFQINTPVPITIKSSGLLDLNGFNDDVGALTFSGGHVTTGTGLLTLTGNVTASPNTNNFARIDGKMDITSTRTFTVANGIYSPDLRITAAISGAGGITFIGPGEMSLTALNSYSGITTVQSGFLVVDNSGALGSTAGGTVVNSTAMLILRFGSHVGLEPLTINGQGASSIFGALSSSFGSNSWDGAITLGSDATIGVTGTNDFLNLAGAISGSFDLTKISLGTLIFSGGAGTANSYAGTVVNAGTLILEKSIPNASIPGNLTIGDGSGGANADVVRFARDNQIMDTGAISIASSGLLDLNDRLDTTGTIDGFGQIDLGSGTLRVGTDGGSATYSGFILGTGSLFKLGLGAWTLTQNNAYSGQTTVSAGTLVVDGSQPQSPITVNGTATLLGSGVIGNLHVFGNVRPGTGPGILTSSNVFFDALGDYFVELNGPAPGTGYDQLNVRGTNQLGSATLHVSTGPDFAPLEGDQFTILNNDGADGIVGTFASLPNNSILTAGGLQFRIRYSDVFNNDVVLTVTNTPLRFVSAIVTGGNGNGVIEPNECVSLQIILTNIGSSVVTFGTGVLIPASDGFATVTPIASFPSCPVGGQTTNTIPFQISTWPNLPCATNLAFSLIARTTSHGSFTLAPFQLFSGAPSGIFQFFSNLNPIGIPDSGSVTSIINVAGFAGNIVGVMPGMFITHGNDADLDIFLQGPDGTIVELSTDNGDTNNNYGTSCAAPTYFNDGVLTNITAAIAPFAGTFRPEGRLMDFRGKGGSEINGLWKLIITDDTANGFSGALTCWNLSLFYPACADGGGVCEACPDNRLIYGRLSPHSATQSGRLTRDSNPSGCGALKTCPGYLVDESPRLARQYDSYTFINGESNACITVQLTGGYAYSVAYFNAYNPADVCQNYLADGGDSNDGLPFNTLSYSFKVAANARFVIVVGEVSTGAGGAYKLSVTGGSCRPRLDIARDPGNTNNVLLKWSTAAFDYSLVATNSLRTNPPNGFIPVPSTPVVINSKLTVTNAASLPARFYELRKP